MADSATCCLSIFSFLFVFCSFHHHLVFEFWLITGLKIFQHYSLVNQVVAAWFFYWFWSHPIKKSNVQKFSGHIMYDAIWHHSSRSVERVLQTDCQWSYKERFALVVRVIMQNQLSGVLQAMSRECTLLLSRRLFCFYGISNNRERIAL